MAGSRELNKYLKELSKEELIKEINKLYSKFKFVKDYYASELGSDKGELLKNCKAKLARLILKSGRDIKPDIASVNKIIREFTSVSVHKTDIIDLMLYKVELCVEFLERWGLEFSGVTRTVSGTYPEILDMIYDNKLEKIFSKRCEEFEAVAGNYGLIENTLTNLEDDES